MTIDAVKMSAAVKQRIANKTNDDRDLLIQALLDATGDALLSATEHKKKTDSVLAQLEEAMSQVRTLTRNNDMLSTKISAYTGAAALAVSK